jgi:hypothetical protein
VERRRAVRTAAREDPPPQTDAAMCPEEERAATRPHFPHRLRIAATTYALPAGTDMAAYENLPGHHLLSIWNLIATRNNELYRSSAGDTTRDVARSREVGFFRRTGPSNVPVIP